MATLQPVDYKQYVYGLFKHKHDIECTTRAAGCGGGGGGRGAWGRVPRGMCALLTRLRRLYAPGTLPCPCRWGILALEAAPAEAVWSCAGVGAYDG